MPLAAWQQVEQAGQGGLLWGLAIAALGVVTLGVAVPLSLAGDVVTLPVAYARYRGAPWATWWGNEPLVWQPLEESQVPAAGEPSAAELLRVEDEVSDDGEGQGGNRQ